ncbi:hypothetical protein A1O1_07201 [Capronia coronata CBS 617.96]|uniref:Uncharacterized protein n=1 Tax=Capronia coronata CBS 617.96 TaxID=1182541 RepID=W9XTL9_9EURO|nr:uncharacterized protein A1O1_07201 [Capronia coronata CBS 617.96]EXJ83578.1 hypothetical protein A1O1_07201 [Capronia coronata CBS 617.96]
MLDNFTVPFATSHPLASISESTRDQIIPPSFLRNPNATIASKHLNNRYAAWQNRDVIRTRDNVKNETERIKLFGGEPGDDVGLCYKMMEVFQGMNWIDSLD